MSSFDFMTLPEVKEALGLTDTTDHDTLLTSLITAASRDAERRMMRDIETTERVEYHDGRDLDCLVLQQGPITDVSQDAITVEEITYDSEAGMSAEELSENRWVAEGLASEGHVLAGRIVRVDGQVFDRGRRNWRITYTGGLAAAENLVPEDIKQATIELLTVMFNLRESHGLVRRDQGEMSIDTIPSANIEAALEARFARYRLDGMG